MNVKKNILFFIMMLVSFGANASSISGTITDDNAKLDIAISSEPFLYEAGGTYTTDRGQSAYIGVSVVSQSDPVELGLGARARATQIEIPNQDDDSGVAFGFGGFYRYTFPGANRFNLFLSAFYYTELLSYGNIERQREFESRVEYAVTETARFFVSYYINAVDFVDIEDTFRLEEDVNVGLSVNF